MRSSLQRETERGREDRMKKVCVWPWKLIKTSCSDNRIKVMEALCARVADFVYVRARVYVRVDGY